MAKKGMTVNMPGVNVNDELAAAAAGVAPAAEVKQEVKTDVDKKAAVKKTVKANTKVKVNVKKEEKEDSIAAALQKQAEKEVKSIAMNLRVKPSVHEKFEQLRKQLRYSQSDFFEVMVKLADETIKKGNV